MNEKIALLWRIVAQLHEHYGTSERYELKRLDPIWSYIPEVLCNLSGPVKS